MKIQIINSKLMEDNIFLDKNDDFDETHDSATGTNSFLHA